MNTKNNNHSTPRNASRHGSRNASGHTADRSAAPRQASTATTTQQSADAYQLTYHNHGGQCIEFNSKAPSNTVIFGMTVKADCHANAMHAFINEGLRRRHLTEDVAARYRSSVKRGVDGIRLG